MNNKNKTTQQQTTKKKQQIQEKGLGNDVFNIIRWYAHFLIYSFNGSPGTGTEIYRFLYKM